ncbi:ricin-type beta-trefoil lectin domain protein [Kitasatospora sp. NPDC018058]|uniref:ricin-type beta-trefoil lectin domain protein n=1 Tax=Kitasatospora sp. NPDC018058 TaxID=3364025 RepID=UPI0037C032C3
MSSARALPSGLAVLAALTVLTAQAVVASPARAADGAPVNGVPVNGASFVLGAGSDGGCLGTKFAQAAAGTPAVRAACQGLLSQRWRLLRVNTTSPAAYVLINSATRRCLVVGGHQRVRTAVTEDCGSVPDNERFTISPAPGGGYTLAVVDNGQCLTAPRGAADLPVQARACEASADQRWTLTRTEPLVLSNPGFENGASGWTFTEHTGVATNNPHSGSRLAYLDAGTGYRVGQQVTAVTAGTYDLSAWIATGAAGGTFSVSVNGTVVQSLTLPEQPTYAKYTLPRVKVAAGDLVTLAVGSSPSGWVNVDDASVAPSAPNDPQISSSDPDLVAMFDWAKTKANSWVQQAGATGVLNMDENNTGGTSTGAYDTTYWAGYPFRSAFYSRDFAHQMVGAHLLGLDAQNKTMLRGFAASATDLNGHYPVWALNLDARTYAAIDYHGPNSFVRELPAPFELVQKAGEAYRWTGDHDYAEDPLLTEYVRTTLDTFISQHPGPIDNHGIPIPQAKSSSIFAGTASYAENAATTYAEAGDALAAQYQAYLSAATLAAARGDSAGSAAYERAAAGLKSYVNTTWSADPKHPADVVHGYDTQGRPVGGWGYETSVLMPMKKLLDPGPRLDSYLKFIDAQDSGPQASVNAEGYTYLPDTYFANHDGATAWKWMQHVYQGVDQLHVSGRMLNGDYPELPFTLLSQTVQGLLGVEPDAAADTLTTASQLPAGIGWLQVAGIPIGNGTVTLRHDGQTSSTLTNTGDTALTWEARFPGSHTGITVDGTPRPTRTVTVDGTTYTLATVTVAPGRTTTVAVTG